MRYADGVTRAAGLDRPVGSLVPRTGPKFEALGVRTAGDLLRYYPRRYADPSRLTDIAGLVIDEKASVVAEVRSCSGVLRSRSSGKLRVEAQVTDGRSVLHLAFFAQREHMAKRFERELRPGRRGLFTGKVGWFNGRAQLANPEAVWFDADDEGAALEHAARPLPVYPASAGLDSAKIATAVQLVLDPLRDGDVPDPVPDQVRDARGLGDLLPALRAIHRPETEEDWRQARRRQRYEEAFVLQAELARRRARAASQPAVARPHVPGGLLDAFDARLPFTLTAGQRAVGEQVAAELAQQVPMQRLLQGEVGSGKTVVALRAMLQVVDSGGQAALLAPTEVLAAQHARSLRAMLGDLAEGGMLGGAEQGTRVALLTGSVTGAARKQALLDAASGAAGIVVGTHALLEKTVQFADLGLVVVDEQHRFGVEQRDALRAKAAAQPHLLAMTATPIPRTVAMTVFGDLETSVLDELPAGRSPITTFVVPAHLPAWMSRTWARVREEVAKGGRAYVVCPRITGDDDDGADLVADEPATLGEAGAAPRRPPRAVLEVVEELRSMPELAGVGVGMLHGKLAPDEKDRALADFASGAVPVLVSTTVVEVGVDVPEATAMVILDADLFGVSQLHQLRGRVGRGSAPGVCLLVSGAHENSPGHERLRTVAETLDGFALAAFDLEQRREGDVLGASQSGASTSLRLLRVTRDGDLIEQARADARAVVEQDPELESYPALRDAIDLLLAGERDEFLDRA
ncbi:ATP-dependent DNA helicase RecG [Cellulomonas palmilytica]|uniref:ATP-dependent DNA helicase RecG n=1 Tax=Cellulomonas palmilytica TaxID=2608402 RepID=UPI001F2BFE78|nr:ATP-dependent DNA helicase RecG [Cellulomonas palmilytica]UJP39486.1 ATP-dependent DNA helicase RecG [Cellulomonas palmilytica]